MQALPNTVVCIYDLGPTRNQGHCSGSTAAGLAARAGSFGIKILPALQSGMVNSGQTTTGVTVRQY